MTEGRKSLGFRHGCAVGDDPVCFPMGPKLGMIQPYDPGHENTFR
jgi:hypothetical protein